MQQAAASVEEGESPVTEQRRLRHVCEVLVRNLSIPASFAEGGALPYGVRPSLYKTTNSSFSGRPTSPVAGPSSGGPLSPGLIKRPQYGQRRSRDDLDLHIPTLHRKNTARRKRTISGGLTDSGSVIPSTSARPAAANEVDNESLRDVTVGSNERQKDAIHKAAIDTKGKGRARDVPHQQDTYLKSIQEASISSLPEEDPDDSEVVFAWTSASSKPGLQRSRSKSSIKSASSKRSISSTVSKHIFRHSLRGKGARNKHSDNEGESGSSGSESSGGASPRRGGNDGRASSPISHHVSFQMSSDPPPALSSSFVGLAESEKDVAIRRARSASRGSIFSVASGSSASTIRPPVSKQSEKEQRLLRQQRYENIRAHLVRSRLSLSVKCRKVGTADQASTNQPQILSRLRTHSLPLVTEDASQRQSSSQTSRGTETHIYLSRPHAKGMDPSFLLESSNVTCSTRTLDQARREHLIVARVWVEMPPELVPTMRGGDAKTASNDWTLLIEWDLDLKKLVSLGTDPKLFPQNFPPNTLIFKLSNTDEYYTARLPAFMLADAQDERHGENLEQLPFNDDPEEEDGNVSDPGPATSLTSRLRYRQPAIPLIRDMNRDRERLLARRRMIFERSARETRMLRGADDEDMRMSVNKELELLAIQRESAELQADVDGLLAQPVFLQKSAHDNRKLANDQYRGDLQELRAAVTLASEARKHRQCVLNDRKQRLGAAQRILHNGEVKLAEAQDNHQLDLAVYTSIKLSTSQRRASLISELSSTFPVDLLDAANVLFGICDLALPNGDYEAQQQAQRTQGIVIDEESVSSALGYVAQAVQLLAAYLTLPLYYPLRCMGSRSLVQDPISQMKGPKIFPLYSRGVDRYRFEYAVFLLNKDIEQIMLEFGLGVMDIAHTLPNLKSIYLTLSSDATLKPATAAPASKASTITILQAESKGKSVGSAYSNGNAQEGSVRLDSSLDGGTANGDVSAASDSMTSTISALEKLLGGAWPSKQPPSKDSLPKSRRRHADASKTMTLLGGRSSSSVTH